MSDASAATAYLTSLVPSIPSLLVLLVGAVLSVVAAGRWRPPLAAWLGAVGFGLAFLLHLAGAGLSALTMSMARDGASAVSIGQTVGLLSTALQLAYAVADVLLVVAVVLPDRRRG